MRWVQASLLTLWTVAPAAAVGRELSDQTLIASWLIAIPTKNSAGDQALPSFQWHKRLACGH